MSAIAIPNGFILLTARRLPRRPGDRKLPKPPGRRGDLPSPPQEPSGKKPLPRPRGGGPRRPKRGGRGSPSLIGRLFKLVIVVAFLAILAGGLVGGFVYYQLRQTLPVLDGRASLPGIDAEIEIVRDQRGVPHVFAQTDLDLSRATGFVHAQDRMFQMDMARRLGQGRMAEWFGPALVDSDRLSRRYGLVRAAQAELDRLSADSRAHLEAYAQGVNAFLATRTERPLLEYRLLELTPEPWTPLDSLAISKWFALSLSENASVERLRIRLADEIGWEQAYILTGRAPPESPPDGYSGAIAGRRPSRQGQAGPNRPSEVWAERLTSSLAVRGASNAWVVGPTRSLSGASLIASDPHLSIDMPSVWYLMHLSGDSIRVAGATIPGVPSVIVGRNEHIAWGITALYADVQDYYLETPNPSQPDEVAVLDGWERLETTTESIRVRDADDVVETVQRSRHGTIQPERHTDGRLFALRWEGLLRGDHVLATLNVNRARSWQEFIDALSSWSSPPASFLYADVEGNIGFFPAGDIPVRVAHDGTFPVDAARGEFDWQGSIPHDLKPMRFNPPEGYIVSANHQMLGEDVAYSLGGDVLSPLRADRIESLLTSSDRISAEDMIRIQNDRFDGSSTAVLQYLLQVGTDTAVKTGAVEALRRWDGQMDDGAAPAIFQAVYRHLVESAFRDEMTDETYEAWLDYLEVGHLGGLAAILHDPESPIWDDRQTPARETREEIFSIAFGAAMDELSAAHGDDVSTWSWGRLHAVEFRHPLGYRPPLNLFFDRSTTTYGGSTFSIANAMTSLTNPYAVRAGTSLRFTSDLGSGQTTAVVPSGQSGHPMSPFYFDQNEPWAVGQSPPLATERAGITPTATLVLNP